MTRKQSDMRELEALRGLLFDVEKLRRSFEMDMISYEQGDMYFGEQYNALLYDTAVALDDMLELYRKRMKGVDNE